MNKRTIRFLIILVLAIGALLSVQHWCYVATEREDSDRMRAASLLATKWFRIVEEQKKLRGIEKHAYLNSSFSSLLGDEYSEITTTLGSIEAKTTAANPEFAALFVRMFHEAGISSRSTVGVTLSGSFPSLAIATLAALQTIGAKAVITSSLGASSYGANQPQATWIDIEHWLIRQGGLKYTSALVTMGGEDDSGQGLPDEGKITLLEAAKRNGVQVYIPASYEDALNKRLQLFTESRISLLVNIGGNHTSLGNCAHSTTIPNGYHQHFQSCLEDDRGLIARVAESKIPFIHLLNIRDLAVANGMPLIPDGREVSSLYTVREVRKIMVAMISGALLLSLVVLRKRP